MADEPSHPLDRGLPGLRDAYELGLDPSAVIDEVLDRVGRSPDRAVWIDVEPAADLMTAARALRREDRHRQPLWGVPFGVKDNIDVVGRATTDGMAGPGRVAARSALVVERLLAAGALYVGKTNLDPLATGLVGTRSPYGTPRNPFDPDLVPGGSSSGSAVAVARRHVPLALGTDTAGSGRVPAALCGVVGTKAAPGTHPLDGVTPASPTIDCVSTFAATVADAIAAEAVLAGQPWPVASGPLHVARPADDPSFDAHLAALGHTTVSVDLRPFHEAGDLLYDGPWLADRTMALDAVLRAADPGTLEIVRSVVARGNAVTGSEVFAAIDQLRRARREMDVLWRLVDVLVLPTVSFVPTLAEVAADPIGVNARLGRNTTFANLLGLAAIAVPAAGGPGGTSVVGPRHHAGAIAAIAAGLHGEVITAGEGTSRGHHLLAVVGAHLSGQPLNPQLTDAGATLVWRGRTAPSYRLYRLDGGPPARPALECVSRGGRPIEVEVWSIDDAGLGRVTAAVAPPLGIGSVELEDGRWVKGFVCEPRGLATALDITEHGGWRAYQAAMG
ncbi:MAG: amidase family protein [Acidimicrobiales bacterium]